MKIVQASGRGRFRIFARPGDFVEKYERIGTLGNAPVYVEYTGLVIVVPKQEGFAGTGEPLLGIQPL